jgi:hypothetical protein
MRGKVSARDALAEIQAVGLLADFTPLTHTESLLDLVNEAYLLAPRREDHRRLDRALVFDGPPTEVGLQRLFALFEPPLLHGIALFRVSSIGDDGRRTTFERMTARSPSNEPVTFDYRTFIEVEQFVNRLLVAANHSHRLYALHETENQPQFVVLPLTPEQAAVLHRYNLLDVGDRRTN